MGSQLELAISVVAALVIILALTLGCGRLAQRVRQPRVMGEMLAGVVLGPSVLGALLPSVQQSIFTPDVKSVLYVLSTIGLTFYMFLVGASIDHRFLERRAVRRAAGIACIGLAVPLALGAGASPLLIGQLAQPGASQIGFAVFMGGVLAITAFPMLASILQERRMSSTPMGSLTLVAAAIDDAGAWALLAIVAALSAGSFSGALVTILGTVIFAVLALTVGRRLLGELARRVERAEAMTHESMLVVLLAVLGCAWFTDLIGIHSMLGGFIAGLAMPASPVLRRELLTRLMDMNAVLLLPVFFVFSGLNTKLTVLTDLRLLPILALITVLAFAGKYLSCTVAARAHGLPWRHASALGALMNARGLMVLVFINIGLARGLISQQLFAILVVMAIVTTASAMPLYRASFPDWLEDIELKRRHRPRSAATGRWPHQRQRITQKERKAHG